MQNHRVRGKFAVQFQVQLFADGFAAERMDINVAQPDNHAGPGRAVAENVVLIKFQDFRAAQIQPVVRRENRLATLHDERVGQHERPDFGLIVIGGFCAAKNAHNAKDNEEE